MRAAAIIIMDGKILLIHRHQDGVEFYVVPGGGTDGEPPEVAVVREVCEETGLRGTVVRKLWELTNPNDGRIHQFFLVDVIPGPLHLDGPELLTITNQNRYEPVWRDLAELPLLSLKPEPLKELIVRDFCS